MVGECLTAMGCGTVIGVDILQEAADAAERDRPDAYAEYVVGDLTDPSPEVREALGRYRFGVMTTVAALGFGDVPPDAFAYAFSHLVPGGWLAFCIKEDFLADEEPSGFSQLIHSRSPTARSRSSPSAATGTASARRASPCTTSR
jgi:hypothetical protein